MCDEAYRIIEYLQTRPIAPILEQSDEKGNIVALKFMYILDNETERSQLYDRIRNAKSASLMQQLMQFHTFKSFKFYDYNVKRGLKTFVLQCTACKLIGPYPYILSHMAINHNLHIASKMCGYCDRVELQKHFDSNTLGRCYGNYLRDRNIYDWDANVCKIVVEFYDMLKRVSDQFSIITIRSQNYAAKRYVARKPFLFIKKRKYFFQTIF